MLYVQRLKRVSAEQWIASRSAENIAQFVELPIGQLKIGQSTVGFRIKAVSYFMHDTNWLVKHEDGSMEVLTDKEFNRRWEQCSLSLL